MTRVSWYLALIAFSVGVFAPSRSSTPKGLTILFVGNRQGFTKACGCNGEANPASVAREAVMIRKCREEEMKAGREVWVVDVGNNLVSGPTDALTRKLLKALPVDYSADLEQGQRTKEVDQLRLSIGSEPGQPPADGIHFHYEFRKLDGGLTLYENGQSIPAPNRLTLVARRWNSVDGKEEPASVNVPIDESLPEDPAMSSLIASDTVERRDEFMLLLAKNKTARTPSDAATCGTCHVSEYSSWLGSKHAKALDTLIEKKQTTATCVPCHSTNFQRNEGFVLSENEPEQAVTCISCHDAKGLHAKEPLKPFKELLDKNACISCHTPTNSARFNFATYRGKVHGAP